MHPALSVIFFTTLSGAGYGLLIWSALAALSRWPAAPAPLLVCVVLALVLVDRRPAQFDGAPGQAAARVARVLAVAHAPGCRAKA